MIRVLTYNIHKAIGGIDRRYRPQRIIEAIQRQQPDIVFMQEVDDGVPRSNKDRQVEVFAEALDFKHYAFQRNVHLKQGHYGNAILSRFPLSDVQDIDLTIPLKKRRRALVAHGRLTIGTHHRTILLANLHLGLAGFERKMQLKRLLESEVVSRTHQHTPTLIGGDFNDVWSSLGKRIMEPGGFQPVSHAIRTFPAAFPARPLDQIYFRGDVELDHAFACRSKIAKAASDHLPLVADLVVGIEQT